MLQIIPALLGGLTRLADKLIVDKDKKAEFAFKSQEMTHELSLKLLDMKTYPWIDGLVKLAYASGAIVKGLFRPIVSAGLIGYALYDPTVIDKLHNMGTVGDAILTAIFGSFPGWMVSRHVEKKQKQQKTNDNFEDWGD